MFVLLNTLISTSKTSLSSLSYHVYYHHLCSSHNHLLHELLQLSFFFFLIDLFIYLFLAALGLCYCARAFSSCGERELLFIAVRGLLIAVASLVAEHGLQMRGLSSCGTWAQLPRDMWNLPGPGLEPMSPSFAGGFLTTAPLGKSCNCLLTHGVFQPNLSLAFRFIF